MEQVMLPYILPLLLGRTFNLDTMQIGVDIFPKNVTENPIIIQNPVTESNYKIVDNTVESRNLLDVDGSFSLNVKGGIFKAGASGAYLTDKYNRENTVEVATRAVYQTITEQLPTDAKPNDLWKTLGDAVGTHFVRSITYGGELIVAVRMECNSTRDKQRIKAALDVGGRIEIFDIGVEVFKTVGATRSYTENSSLQIGDLYAEVENVIRPFYEVIGKLDMSGSSDQLKPANDAYGLAIPGVFYKKYLILRQTIARDQGEWTLSRGNGATYIHWGKTNCSSVAEKMSNGYVVGPSGDGGGSNFLCLPDKPQFGNPPANQKGAAILQGTSYQFPNDKNRKLACSNCRLGARGTVQTFFGRTQCPEDWDYVYDGILMSGSRNSLSTKFVCLDKKPVEGEEVNYRNPLLPDWAVIPEESSSDDEEKQLLFTCVVCAK
ncbi:uncharacterized protein NPIL_624171 [Nephila pilipes]|uniref:Uncharacterized protein n=1 Tax=Nephila pilipes TaxID=299642 RepID=A0A8X6NDB4_NEPPI|nr:uncharacterized protein NPIL_624171 [Nephila pilipes]